MLGGLDEQGSALRELWRHDLVQGAWSLLSAELPRELAQPLGATFDLATRTLYVAARGRGKSRISRCHCTAVTSSPHARSWAWARSSPAPTTWPSR
jgi:hypothetical protein